MDISGKVMVITGAGSGIGAATARQAARAGAKVVVSDLDGHKAKSVAEETGGPAIACNVAFEDQIVALIDAAEAQLGPVDIFMSNAGFGRGEPDHAASAPDKVWQLSWDVHVMSHVWAARRLLPGMIARGSGYFVNVASAAGLLSQIGDAAYSATKHAAVSFADSLAIAHGQDGIGVSVVCPQYVATPLLGLSDMDAADRASLLTADDVARVVLAAVAENRHLVLPHPQVSDYTRARAADHDAWIRGMRGLRAKVIDNFGRVAPEQMYRLFS